jgi:hypothetical protein
MGNSIVLYKKTEEAPLPTLPLLIAFELRYSMVIA